MAYFPTFQSQVQPQQAQKQNAVEIFQDPPEPSVTPRVASKAIERLVTIELQNAGFERAVQPALERLEVEVATCMALHFLTVDALI